MWFGADSATLVSSQTHLDSLFCGAIDVKLRRRSLDDRILGDEATTGSTSDKMQVDVDESTTRKTLPLPTTSTQPAPHPSSPRAAGLAILKQDSTYELAPTDPIHLEIQDFHSLFTLAPQVHPHLGSAVWQLRNGIVLREEQLEEEAKAMEGMWKTALMGEVEIDRSFEDVYNKVGSLSTGRSRTNGSGNAEAGPGPSSSNRYGMGSGSAMTSADPMRLKLGLQPRETPSLSRPPTPVVSHSGSSLLNGTGSGGSGGETRHVGANPLKRPLDDLDRFAGAGGGIRAIPGPGGIIPRPGRGLLSGSLGPGGPGGGRGLNPSLSSASNGGLGLSLGSGGYGPGTRRELIQRELEARKLYKVVDGRGPMLLNTTIPPMMANQVGVAPLTAVGVAAGVMSMPPGAAPGGAGAGAIGPGTGSIPGQPAIPTTNLDPNDQGGPPIMLPPPLPPHGPNHWPYVDPASIFKDILG